MNIFTFRDHKTTELVLTVAYSLALVFGVVALIMLLVG
jgi:hypothetical protein